MKELIVKMFQKLGLGVFGVIYSGEDFADKLNTFTYGALDFKCIEEGRNTYKFQGTDSKGNKVYLTYLTNDSGAIKRLNVSED